MSRKKQAPKVTPPQPIETERERAIRLWNEKEERDRQREIDKTRMCRCGHALPSHKEDWFLSFDPSTTFRRFCEGSKGDPACQCPAFLEVATTVTIPKGEQ